MTEVTRGKLIVVEGIDGSGKSTQVHRLAKALSGGVHSVWPTVEPTATPLGYLIRQVLAHQTVHTPQYLAALFAADRLHHCEEMEKALAEGTWIVCDRYVLSSYVYQTLAGCSFDWVKSINSQALAADLTLLLDVPPREAAERRVERGTAQELFETDDTTARAHALFQELLGQRGKIGTGYGVSGVGSEDEVTQRLLDGVQWYREREAARAAAKVAAKEHALQEVRRAFGK